MTRIHFHHQFSQLNEARGWAVALIWNETGGYYLLKASAVSSGKLQVLIPYNISIQQSIRLLRIHGMTFSNFHITFYEAGICISPVLCNLRANAHLLIKFNDWTSKRLLN